MRRTIAALAVGCSALLGQGFDQTAWGMTEAQVRQAYPDASFFAKGRDRIAFLSERAGVPVEVGFRFAAGTLTACDVTPQDTSATPKAMLDAAKLKTAMAEKYGAPTTRTRTSSTWLVPGSIVSDSLITTVPGRYIYMITYKPAAGTGL